MQLPIIRLPLSLKKSVQGLEKSINSIQPSMNVSGILVQQHYGGTTFFNRSWAEFKVGFGEVTDNYWIGNERLHQLTKEGRYKLRIDLLAKTNSQWYWAEYQTFMVWDESTQYRLEIGGYNGTAGDSLRYHNGYKFSTRDRDNDVDSRHCAVIEDRGNNGGFWYFSCANTCLNSPIEGECGFSWSELPIDGGGYYRTGKLLVSRMTLLLL